MAIRRDIFVCLIILIAAISVYSQVINCEFVNFDDDRYVTENKYVQQGLTIESIKWSFTNLTHMCWQPLTWLSHMMDFELFGLNPGRHHLTNLILHIINALLLFMMFRRVTGAFWQSAFVGMLFALHPVNVDTVAWVAERKNILSTFFWIVSMWAYFLYVKYPGGCRYFMTLSLFALGLMAKPMIITLPFVFLLMDYWPLKRFDSVQFFSKSNFRLVIEKTPFFLLTIAYLFIVSITLSRAGSIVSVESASIQLRIANALVSYVKYIGMMIWPQDLAVLYPFPTVMPPAWQIAGSAIFLLCVSVLVIRMSKNEPFLITGWFWFLGTLVPVIGIIQGGMWPAMADRWAYVPFIGLFVMISWGGADLLQKICYKQLILSALAVLIISAMMAATWKQTGYWKNSITLFRHTLDVTSNNFVAHNNLGVALDDHGQIEEAVSHYQEAIRIKPDYARAHFGLGSALIKQNQIEDATSHYLEAIRIRPDYVEAHNNLGVVLDKQGRTDDAIYHYFQALKIDPDLVDVNNNLGMILYRQGRFKDAVYYYSKALAVEPDLADTHNNMGIALIRIGDFERAIASFKAALRIKPDNVEIKENIKKLIMLQKRNK